MTDAKRISGEPNAVDIRIGRRKARGGAQLIALDARTKSARRLAEIVDSITGGATMTAAQAAQVRRAAELVLIAEDYRARMVSGLAVSIEQLVRLERLAELALKRALAALPRPDARQPGLAAQLRQGAF